MSAVVVYAWKVNDLVTVTGPEVERKVPVRRVRDGAESEARRFALEVVAPGSLVGKIVNAEVSLDAACSRPQELLRDLLVGAPKGLSIPGLRSRLQQLQFTEEQIGSLLGADGLSGVRTVQVDGETRVVAAEHAGELPLPQLLEEYCSDLSSEKLRKQLSDRVESLASNDARLARMVLDPNERADDATLDLSTVGSKTLQRLFEGELPAAVLWSVVVSSANREAVAEATKRLRARPETDLNQEAIALLDSFRPPWAGGDLAQTLTQVSRVTKGLGTPALVAAAVRTFRAFVDDRTHDDIEPVLRALGTLVAQAGLDREGFVVVHRQVGPGPLPVPGARPTLRQGVRREFIAGVVRVGHGVPVDLWDGLDAAALVALSSDEDVLPELIGPSSRVARAAMLRSLRQPQRSAVAELLPADERLWTLLDDDTLHREFEILIDRDPVLGRLAAGLAAKRRDEGLEAEVAELRQRESRAVEVAKAAEAAAEQAAEEVRRSEARAAHFEQMAREADRSASGPLEATLHHERMETIRRIVDSLTALASSSASLDAAQLRDALAAAGIECVGRAGERISAADVQGTNGALRFLTDERSDQYEVIEPAWVFRNGDDVTPIVYGQVAARRT